MNLVDGELRVHDRRIAGAILIAQRKPRVIAQAGEDALERRAQAGTSVSAHKSQSMGQRHGQGRGTLLAIDDLGRLFAPGLR